jgi:hypothetical protein
MRRRPYLKIWTDHRIGRTYVQFRRRGYPTIPLPPLDAPDFDAAYAAALERFGPPSAARRTMHRYEGNRSWKHWMIGREGTIWRRLKRTKCVDDVSVGQPATDTWR